MSDPEVRAMQKIRELRDRIAELERKLRRADYWTRRAVERAEAAEAKVVELERRLKYYWSAAYRLDWRGIEHDDACLVCGGSGYRTYPNTSAWLHGVGEQTLTTSVCDECWGSGSRSKPWMSWRRGPAE